MITAATDAPGFNFGALAKGTQVAGYTTGSGGIQWTADMWRQFPAAVRICQDSAASDHTADVLDVESGAATLAECAPWKKAAQKAFLTGARPGQREPAIYCSLSMVTSVVNALKTGGVDRCPIWMAHFGIGVTAAENVLRASTGPYPIIGVQFANGPKFDSDLFLTPWLENVSGKAVIMQEPPGQWNDPKFWTWQDCCLIGTGVDGKLHVFAFDPKAGTWTKAE